MKLMMELLAKLETLINNLLLKLGSLIWKSIPAPVVVFLGKLKALKLKLIQGAKNSPAFLKALVLKCISKVKSFATTVNWKSFFLEKYQKAMAEYKDRSGGTVGKIKGIVLAIFGIMSKWLQGLTGGQILLILGGTGASVLAIIGIGFSGHRLLKNHMNGGREPASEEIAYERPDYYKKQTKHFEMTNFRLPIYIPSVNEVRTVDIDFIATLSNRNAKMYLEKFEFQLRDHLIIEIEPSIASFHLDEEGKAIIKIKIWEEVNFFLQQRGIEGEVVELKITYALAN